MKKPIVIAGVAVGTVCVIGVLLAGLQPQNEANPTDREATRTATITSSTEATEENSPDTTKDKAVREELPNKAVYVTYDEDVFSAHLERSRILFFYDKSHAPSRALDTLITDSLKSLPDDISVFKTTIEDAPEEASTLGVTEPGVALSFTQDAQLKGVYVAPEKPNLETLLTILGIEV